MSWLIFTLLRPETRRSKWSTTSWWSQSWPRSSLASSSLTSPDSPYTLATKRRSITTIMERLSGRTEVTFILVQNFPNLFKSTMVYNQFHLHSSVILNEIELFVLASISGKIRLQKAEPGHKLCWICRDPVWHLSFRNAFYLLLATFFFFS